MPRFRVQVPGVVFSLVLEIQLTTWLVNLIFVSPAARTFFCAPFFQIDSQRRRHDPTRSNKWRSSDAQSTFCGRSSEAPRKPRIDVDVSHLPPAASNDGKKKTRTAVLLQISIPPPPPLSPCRRSSTSAESAGKSFVALRQTVDVEVAPASAPLSASPDKADPTFRTLGEGWSALCERGSMLS